MASSAIIQSRGADLEIRSVKGKTSLPHLTVLACGGDQTLQIDNPVTEVMLRGFGRSTVSDTDASDLDAYLNDIDATLAQRSGDKSASPLLGYSHGGYFATQYAIANPDRVSALILIEPALFTDRDELKKRAELAEQGDDEAAIQSMLRYVGGKREVSGRRGGATKEILSEVQSSQTLAQEFRVRADNPVSTKDLARLKMPVLLIGGTESEVADSVTRSADAIPYANVVWIRGAGHLELFWRGDEKTNARVSAAIRGFTEWSA